MEVSKVNSLLETYPYDELMRMDDKTLNDFRKAMINTTMDLRQFRDRKSATLEETISDSYTLSRMARSEQMRRLQGWTEYAFRNGFVELRDREPHVANMPTGTYIATGKDYKGRSFNRHYTIGQKDTNSFWSMWHDFNCRWGLTTIWHVTDNGRRKIYGH